MKVYYTVQIVKYEYCGYKTHTRSVESIHHFEQTDLKKAKNLWKKRAHNDIIRHEVNYLDEIPYYTDEHIFGQKIFNAITDKYELVFKRKDEIVEKIEI